MERASNLSPINNQLEALALHLGINSDIEVELSTIEHKNTETPVHTYKHKGALYSVGRISNGQSADKIIEFNSSLWAITSLKESKEMINADKKITKATFKSFLRKKKGSLYINVKSSFDGMTDCCEDQKGGWGSVVYTNNNSEHTQGIEGIWLVGSSRDSYSFFEEGGFIGIEVYNCCGHFIVAVKAQKGGE